MKLEELRDIVRVIQKNELLLNPPINFKQLNNEDSKIAEFYQILQDYEIQDDRIAAAKIYPQNNSKNNYKSLKSYFFSRVINNIASFDFSGADKSDHVKA